MTYSNQIAVTPGLQAEIRETGKISIREILDRGMVAVVFLVLAAVVSLFLTSSLAIGHFKPYSDCQTCEAQR